MIYTTEVQHMCPVAKGAYHGPAPIPEEGKWVQAKQLSDISGFTHGIGWCAPQQGACKLTLNVKEGVIQEALVETIGCSGMTHSAAMASEILIGKTILEALNTDLVCDAINTAMREQNLTVVTLGWAALRGLSASLMHGLCTMIIGAGLPYVKKQRKLFCTGIFGLFTVSATMHALFNLLIQSDYSWLGACFPMVLYVLFYVVRRTGRIRLPFLSY